MTKLNVENFYPIASKREVKELNILFPFGYDIAECAEVFINAAADILQPRILNDFDSIIPLSVLENEENVDKLNIITNISGSLENDLFDLFDSLTFDINSLYLKREEKYHLSLFNTAIVVQFLYNTLKKEILKYKKVLGRSGAGGDDISTFSEFENKITLGIEELLLFSLDAEDFSSLSSEELHSKIGNGCGKCEKRLKNKFSTFTDDVTSLLSFTERRSFNIGSMTSLSPLVYFLRLLSLHLCLLREFPNAFADGKHIKEVSSNDDNHVNMRELENEQKERKKREKRKLVSLMDSFLSNSFSFIYNGEEDSIALRYVLDDEVFFVSLSYDSDSSSWQLEKLEPTGISLGEYTFCNKIEYSKRKKTVVFDGKELEDFLLENPFEEDDFDDDEYDNFLDEIIDGLSEIDKESEKDKNK